MTDNAHQTARNVRNLVSAFSKCIDTITTLIEQENTLIAEGKILQAVELVNQKCNKINQLQELNKKIKCVLLENNDDKVKSAFITIKDKYTKLQKLINENEILVRASIKVNEDMISIYKASIVDKIAHNSGYNKKGKLNALQSLGSVASSSSIDNMV